MSATLQQSEEWLALRKTKIGASDSPIIMGVSPWQTPYQLWQHKVGIAPSQKKSFSMNRGLRLEEKAREEFEKMTGLLVFPEVIFHKDINWMMASLDGIDIERKNIVEIKCPGHEDHKKALQNEVPEKYFPQLQHQLEVAQLEMAYYFSFDGETGTCVEMYRDDKYIKKMLKKEEEFWDCVQNFTLPKMTERDYCQREDDTWKQVASEWTNVSQQMENLEIKEKDLRSTLVSMSNNKNSKGGGITLSKQIRKGAIDYPQIEELKKINLELYRKSPIEFWKIVKEKSNL